MASSYIVGHWLGFNARDIYYSSQVDSFNAETRDLNTQLEKARGEAVQARVTAELAASAASDGKAIATSSVASKLNAIAK
jgi:hypothetical protein